MRYILFLSLAGIALASQINCSMKVKERNSISTRGPSIIIESRLPDNYARYIANPYDEDITELGWMPVNNIALRTDWRVEKEFIRDNKLKWIIYSDKPVISHSALLGYGVFINPGDSVCIIPEKDGYKYSGKGVDGLELQARISKLQGGIKKPSQDHDQFVNLDNYMEWKRYLDKQLELILPAIDSYERKIPSAIFNLIKTHAINRIEKERTEVFMSFINYKTRYKAEDLTLFDYVAIFDSTMNGPASQWLRSYSDYEGDPWFFYQYTRIKVWKKYNFDFSHDSLDDNNKRVDYYRSIKEDFKGLLREKLLQYTIAQDIIKGLRFAHPKTDSILNDYYKQPGFPEYKQWMRSYEDSMRIKFASLKK